MQRRQFIRVILGASALQIVACGGGGSIGAVGETSAILEETQAIAGPQESSLPLLRTSTDAKQVFSASGELRAEIDSLNHLVRVVNEDGQTVWTVGAGGPETELNFPRHAQFVQDGRLIVLERGGSQLRVYGTDGASLESFGGFGSQGGELSYPADFVLVEESQLLYCADTLNHSVACFDLSGNFVDRFGSLGAEAGQLNGPIAIEEFQGELYVLERGNRRFSVFTAGGQFLRHIQIGDLEPSDFIIDEEGQILLSDPTSGTLALYSLQGVFLEDLEMLDSEGHPVNLRSLTRAIDGSVLAEIG